MIRSLLNPVNPIFIVVSLVVLVGCDSTPDSTQNTTDDQDQFAMHIRSAPALTPEQERASFKIPQGFNIELFASEPDIGKPMNISFDARGRLWVTQSQAYPFEDSIGNQGDKISILEDTDHDGKADRFITFADSLNIPIGIVPVSNGAIAYSIPNVYHLIDLDGDDQVDQRKVLLGGFESTDTHGMVNNFFRGLDGWIHADHGFSNVSRVVGTDNKEPLVMTSGNTFRFRPDGSGVSFTTTGRVNPFGYAIDEFGYWYSVDCHSSPIYQLIRGADYPHFGKKPTGIGFGPSLMPHNYGSTALAGLEYYTGSQFPADYQSNFYLGDVVKSRVYRASITMSGTTPVAEWMPDFITSEDPWFRPVDVKLGPDGALYIADFYNRIIGHYEVPLDHPGRDRERGRIWRITYENNRDQHRPVNWENASLEELIAGLDEPSLTVRMMVADQIVDRFGANALPRLEELLENPGDSRNQFMHSLWILHRLDGLEQKHIVAGLSSDSEHVQVHTLRILFEMGFLNSQQLALVKDMTQHQSPHIQRAATMILGQYPSEEHAMILLDLGKRVSKEDTHMSYAIKQCLRDNLRDPEVLDWALNQNWKQDEAVFLAKAMMGVDDYRTAVFIASYLDQFQWENEDMELIVSRVTRLLPESDLNSFSQKLRGLIPASQLNQQLKMVEAVELGHAQRGIELSGYAEQWSVELASQILTEDGHQDNLTTEADQLREQQIFACKVAEKYQVNALSGQLNQLIANRQTDASVRSQAAQALLAMQHSAASDLMTMTADTTENEQFRESVLVALLEHNTSEATPLVGELLNSFSFSRQKNLVSALAHNPDGIDQILAAAASLDISPKMLLDPSINTLLQTNMNPQQTTNFNQITENLSPFSKEIDFTIRVRSNGFATAGKSSELGAKVFQANCAMCHQIGGKGAVIGPQLDGIGNWGLRALTEKILDPNRNISKAFVNYSITLDNGTVRQGLFRRDEGNTKIFADATGSEFSIPKDQIARQQALPFTLMPDNFANTISESDYYSLMEYLLNQK